MELPCRFRRSTRVLYHLHLSFAAILLVGTSASASPKPALWSDVDCYAYSKAAAGYACLDFSLGSDSGVSGPRDFETWTATEGTAWNGHKAILLLSKAVEEIAISRKEYDTSSTIVRHRKLSEARRMAKDRGYRARVARRKNLPSGKWVSFQGVWLRFDTRRYEGSASFQNHGSLRLRCEPPSRGSAVTTLAEDNQAESAVAFAARGARSIAVGFLEMDGGEGAAYYNTEYLHISLQRCRKQCRAGASR